MKEGEPKKGNEKLKEGQEVWRGDLKEEEIRRIKEKIGKDFENVKFKFTEGSGKMSIEEGLQLIASETEASLVERLFLARELEKRWDEIEVLEQEIEQIYENLTSLTNQEEKNDLKGKIEERKLKIQEILNKKFITEEMLDNN